MKTLITAACAASALCVLPGLAQAQDQTAPTGLSGSLGYAAANSNHFDLGAVQGRLAYRFVPNFGVEGELAFGVKDDQSGLAPPQDIGLKLRHAEAMYGVGYLSLSPNTDLFGRIGYGNSREKVNLLGNEFSRNDQSWNFGVGGQHYFDGKNGVRLDYTRQEFTRDSAGHADVYSVAYTRRF